MYLYDGNLLIWNLVFRVEAILFRRGRCESILNYFNTKID